MRHSIIINGFAYRLRPIGDTDASFVVQLRSNQDLNGFLHLSSPRLADQLTWFASYYERPGDYYFVIERLESGAAEGVISIYGINQGDASGEWGRWILKPGSLAAIESAWLIYRCAFEQLKLHWIFCRTVAGNARVVSFHDSCGITTRRVLPKHFSLGAQTEDAVEHLVDRATWMAIMPNLEKIAQSIARRLRRD